MTSFAPRPDRGSDGRFTVLGSTETYRGAIFSVRQDVVSMPGGGQARRDVVDHLRAVAIVALDADGAVVLIEQYRHPLRRRLWEVPAGLMDTPGEGPLACAQRELAEEAGLAADDWSVLVDLASSPGYCTEAIRVYAARELRPVAATPAVDEEADLRVVRVPLVDAVDAVMDGRIVNATAVAGLLAASHVRAGRDPRAVRPADDDWSDSPALVNHDDRVGVAPPLDGGR